MSARTLTAALGGRWHGSYGTARCPTHDDRSPSLSIRDGVDGEPVFNCFAGCDWRDIKDALRADGLLPERGPGRSGPRLRHRRCGEGAARAEVVAGSEILVSRVRNHQKIQVPPNWRQIGQVVEDVLKEVAARHGRIAGHRFRAPTIDSTQTTTSYRSIQMTNEELNALIVVVNYLWHDERKNFEQCKLNDGAAPDHHVFPHIDTVDSYLFRELGKRAADMSPEQTSNVSPFI